MTTVRRKTSETTITVQAEREGFIIVYPEAQNSAWNAAAGNKTREDLDFISILVQSLQSRFSIDPKHIYATGISNGGGMANRIACDLANLVAAIGPVSGAYNLWQDCHPSRPVPVIAFHGTADKIVPYEGFPIEAVSPPIPKWAAAWAQRNGCDPIPRESDPKPDVHVKTWENCRENATVVLYTIDHQGHSWPGSSLLPEITSQSVNANDRMWEFFQAHPMP
jgi:polyhydroxybutyrate depolymerase